MKKLVLFLSIIMFTFTGFVFACNDDKYADLNISVSSVVSQTSGNRVNFNADENCYEVTLGETFIIDASVSCSSDISKTLIFNSESSESLNHIKGLDTDTENGTKATFKASAPSYDNLFKVKISSYEASNKSKTVYVKVILPLESIALKENLGLTFGNKIDLNSQVIYTSAIPSQYETNEKGANFVLKSFKYLDADGVTQTENLLTDDYVSYGLERDPREKVVEIFRVEKGIVSVVDSSLEGTLLVEAKSIKFDNALEELEKQKEAGEVELTEEQTAKIEKNNKFKAQTEISVVKGISIQDFAFAGGQIGFNVNAQNVKSKLDASLYINSLDTYTLNNKTYYYNLEKVDFSVATTQKIKLDVIVGDAVVDGKPVTSDKGVISEIDSDSIQLVPITTGTGANQKVVGYNTTLQFNASGSNGNAYVDFVVTYSEYENKIEYKFSELYARFVESLSADQLANLDTTHSTVAINCSALPSNIAVLQDGNQVETGNNSMIKIFDAYEEGSNSSTYGTKLNVKLTLASGLTSFKINDQNKIVRVYLKHSEVSNVNVNEYIEIRGVNYNRITLNPTQKTLADGSKEDTYYFDLDLSNDQTSYFYARASKANLSANSKFVFEFENILNSSITTFSGEEVLPNTNKTTLKNLTATLNAKTVKGVENVVAVIKNGEDFYEVDNNHLNSNALYQKVVLKLSTNVQATEKSGSVLGVAVNKYVDEIVSLKAADETIVKIFELSGSSLFASYIEGDEELQFNKAYSIVGTKLGSTTLQIKAENGYTTVIEVEVVNEIVDADRNFEVEATQGYSKVVYQNYLDNSSNPYLSARINGKFNLLWSAVPDKTGVVNVRYDVYKQGTTEKSNVITIDRVTGLVDTREVGKADVIVTMTYYVFDNTSGYYEWTSASYQKSFVFEVFEPATMYRLTNNGISNVYSYDSLGYEYKQQSLVNIGVIISPSNATINASKDSAISYVVDSNSKNLRGSNGVYTAYLQANQTRATEYVTVYITEFGFTTTLKYTVNIYKATQVSAIESAIFEGENEKNQKLFGVDSNDSEVEYISTTNNKTLTFNTTISPVSVYNDDLVVKIFKAQDGEGHGFTTNEFDEDNSYGVLSYNNQSGQTVILDNGRDSFTLNTSRNQTGFFYVVIFARDSMTSKNTGLVYKKYAIEITDGSLSSPYVIETARELMDIANNPSKHYVLGANINLSFMSNWTPIANFTGSLNGFNVNIKEDADSIGSFYKITGLKINSLGSGYVGLFEKILVDGVSSSVGTVMNLAVEVESINLTNKTVNNSFIDTSVNVGAIAGVNEGIISNCSVTFKDISVSIKNKDASVGGVVGTNKGGIFNFPNDTGLSSKSFGSIFSDYKIIEKSLLETYSSKNYLLRANSVDEKFISSNPVNGNMYVSDSKDEINTYLVYAGGIAGSNFGTINGLYGVYNYIEEQNLLSLNGGASVNYLTAYQSQGVDVKVNINHKDSGYAVTNYGSALGGVVGYNADAKVLNTSVETVIGYNVGDQIYGANNYVGGVVGMGDVTTDSIDELNTIYNVMVNAKIRANDYIGGIVGFGIYTSIEIARVENYEDPTSHDEYSQTMILANNNIGGIAGGLSYSTIFTAYSYSYVSVFNDALIQNPDIVSISSENSNVGGILGEATFDVIISAAYSTFGLKSESATANVAGIVGFVSEMYSKNLIVNNVYYIGVLNTTKEISNANVLVNVEKGDQRIYGYYFYYVLDYVDSQDLQAGTNYDSIICVLSHEGDNNALSSSSQDIYDASKTNADYFSASDVYSFEISIIDAGVISGFDTIKTRVLTYVAIDGYKLNFIRSVPETISVGANEDSANEIVDFKLDLSDEVKKYFYYFVDEQGYLHLVARYSALNNTFSLNDLFNVIPNPSMLGKLNILVNAEQSENVLSITDDGKLVLNKVGSSVLKFTIRENVSTPTFVFVDVVKSFDKLLLSNLTNFNTSIINTQSSPVNVRKLTDINIYSLFGEFINKEDVNGKIVYQTITENKKVLCLVQIDGAGFYSLSFDIKYKDDDGNFEFDADSFEISNNTIRFIKDGVYRVVVSVQFELSDLDGNTQNYYFTNFDQNSDSHENEWVAFFNVYTGATGISFDTKSFGLTGNNTKTDLKLTLMTDEANVDSNNLAIYVMTDSNTKYNFIYNEDGGKFDEVNSDNILNISLTQISSQGNSHTFTFNVSIASQYRYIDKIRTFTLYAYDVSVDKLGNRTSVFEATPASVVITLNPKCVSGVTTIHYAYTQQASKLENNANTNSILGNDNANFSYSFSNEPKNSVIAGNEGLFVVDITPYYSNITSVSIESSLSSESGNSLQFVQLVKIAGNGGDYYIYAPQTKATENGSGIYLNKFSYIPSDIAKLSVRNGTYGITMLSDQMVYGFGGNFYSKFGEMVDYNGNNVDASIDDSEIGRLYIKTVAPTNLKVEESFEVYVKVCYNALDENGQLKNFEETYIHKLFVESMPGLKLSVNHDGVERSIIAYTGETPEGKGADYLDIVPIVDEGYKYESISGSLYQTSIPDKKVEGDGYGTTDYFALSDLSNNTGKRLVLGSNARVGDTIVIVVVVSIEYEGYVESRRFNCTIRVVDVVIDNITIKDLDAENTLKITVSTSKQLKVVIDGYGTKDAITDAENAISRSVAYESNSINYWFARSQRTGEYYVNLDSVSIKNNLPFNVQKVAITNDQDIVEVSSNSIGASNDEEKLTVSTLPKLIVLEGSTSSGTVDMQLKFSYVYLDSQYRNGESIINAGQIVFVPNTFNTVYTQEKFFTVEVTEDSNEDNPTPIYDAEKFVEYLSSTTGGDFILMNDITLSQHTAINAKFGSLDGNNKIITIESFAYNPNLVSSSNKNYSINMGLFDTVSSDTIIKNVIVALPNNKKEPMNLTGYSTVNFGGIAAVNNGMITNCDVITITRQIDSNLLNYEEFDYSLNIETSMMINGADVTANIGLLVGINGATGFVTNSRVGRDDVDILTVYDSEATVVYKDKYAYTAPTTLVRVYGRANVGGFVARNSGTISSSYAKNIQLEVNSISSKDFVKTAGFVVQNNGYIYGSFVAGWEEEDMKASEGKVVSGNRKLGGGLYSNGFIGGFVYRNESYIEDCYSNINISGDLTFAAQTSYVKYLTIGSTPEDPVKWISPAVGGFVYTSTEGSLITTSYSLSKIATEQGSGSSRSNTHGAFEGRMESSDVNFVNEGVVTNSYFMLEKTETFSYDHEQAIKLTDDPTIDLENAEETSGINEFISKNSFNSFSFDNDIENLNGYEGTSTGGVWAIYNIDGTHGYPDLISANSVAISSRVINVTKTNNSETNKYYYTYVDGYDIGSVNNPYLISNFDQYNNIFKDAIGQDSFNDNVTTKFTGNIRLIRNINFDNSEEVYSTSIEYTSLINSTSIFDGNYLAMYNITLADKSSGRDSFGLFKDIYYAGVKNLTLAINRVNAGNTTSVGSLAGVIANSNISNVTLVASSANTGVVTGNHYVGALAGIIVSSDADSLFTVSNIKSNLSIIGGVSTANEVNAITTSSVIWERIKPTSTSSGLSELNANLRLHKLPVNVYYAGGIAGILDLHQIVEIEDRLELNVPNVYNIHVGTFDANTILSADYVNYDKKVSIISDYSGGLFGLIGSQTYLEAAEFVAQQGSEDHYISAREIAGGIAAVNFGKISQSYLSYSKEQVIDLDSAVIDYVSINVQDDIHLNTTLFAFGTPKYIGGIAGINIGNGDFGSGNIVDCYSRVDIKNASAIGVGGIAGGAYIGQISNVYSTSSLMGDLTRPYVTKIGAIIGKIFENADEGYFADYHGSVNSDADNLALSNIVAVNLWDTNDFTTLYNYAKNGGKIGALYGEFINSVDSDLESFIKLTQGVYVQNYILKDFADAKISSDNFEIEQLNADTYIELWGVSINSASPNYNAFLSSHLCSGGKESENLIFPNDYRALFSSANSTLRETYFPASRWSRVIWNYDRYWEDNSTKPKILPVLEYGYESSVIRIYTANQFFEKLNSGSSSGKLYVIMNDIDFAGVDIKPISLTFRGQLFGNNVIYKDETGTEFIRKPILFNLSFGNITQDENSNMSISISSIFQNTIGAVFSNFNVVLANYNVNFSSNITTETIASVLVGNAINTTVNNVHIYSSLLDTVNKETSLEGYTYYTDDVRKQEVTVSQGYVLDSKQIVRYSSFSFLKLATSESKNETSSEEFKAVEQWYLKYETSENDNKFKLFRYVNTSTNEIYGVTDFADKLPNQKDYKIDILDCDIKTNATIVGMIMGVGSLSYVSNSSVNVDLNITYDFAPDNPIYIGSMIGRNIGELHTVVSTSNITVNVEPQDTNHDGVTEKISLNSIYVGGFVGNDQGVIRFAYLKNVSINVGNDTNSIETSSGSSGTFIGGMVGSIDRYTTINEAVVGGANFLYLYDCEINAYVMGSSKIAGVIGQNSFTLGDVYFKQTYFIGENNSKVQKSVNVNLSNSNSNSIIGGIVADNNSTTITGVYTNASIIVKASEYENVRIGGVVGYSTNEIKLTNVVNDAEKIEFINTSNGAKIGSLSMGGFVGELIGASSGVSLLNVFNTADIISTQEDVMNIGGMVGAVDGNVFISNGIQLGDIYLGRSKGVGSENAFFTNPHNIGGLVGRSEKTIEQDAEAEGFIVLTTIRDYALAQKTNLQIGPVIGTNGINVKGNMELYFNENIALVSDNGYNSLFKNYNQSSDKENSRIYSRLNDIYTVLNLKVDTTTENLYSRYLEKYFNYNKEDVSTSDYYIGSKILPKVYTKNTTFDDNLYYVLNENISISSSISTEAKGWILNGQGYTISGAYPAFATITEGSAIVGIMQNSNATISASGVIAKFNYGFIFSCGVSGVISGSSGIASFVLNNLGVISTSFSIANIKTTSTTSAGAGLVVYNGNVDYPNYMGNIYCCYYTGTLSPMEGSGASFAGITLNSLYGFVSNSYTMADIDVNTVSTNAKAFPVAQSNNQKLYKVFYDYVAYTGSSDNEGVDVKTASLTNYITSKGIYVWSSSLTGGDDSDKNYDSEVASLLGGNWLKPGIVEQLVALYNGSRPHQENPDEEIKIDTSWFNYGYTTNNFVNIIVGGQENNCNIIKYLTMLYTGNGLASKEMASKEDTKHYTNAFLDYPYMVKHAGILDVLVSSNNISTGVEFKYYLLTKAINFIKYTGKTYWSQTWDDNKVVFAGDLDGNGQTVMNMYSTYGLLRALSNVYTPTDLANGINTSVRNLTIIDSYSKTGLIAGYLGSGVIKNVKFDYNLVYNGNFDSSIEEDSAKYLGKGIYFENTATANFAQKTIGEITFKVGNHQDTIAKVLGSKNANFAGSVVGYMNGGIIDSSCSFSNTYVAVSNQDSKNSQNTTTSYAGGIAGIFVDGNIGGYKSNDTSSRTTVATTSNWNLSGLTVSAVNKNVTSENYVGGIAGYLGEFDSDSVGVISYIQTTKVVVKGSYSVGGFAGVIDGGQVTNCINSTLDPISATNSTITASADDLGFKVENSLTNETVSYAYFGGVVGIMLKGEVKDTTIANGLTIKSPTLNFNSNVDDNLISLGGIAGLVNFATNNDSISKCTVNYGYSIAIDNTNAINKITAGIAGIINGSKLNENINLGIVGKSDVSTISGGIVGRITKGEITSCYSGKDGSLSQVYSTGIAGGIVGVAEAHSGDTVTISSSVFSGAVNGSAISGGIAGYVTANADNISTYLVKINNCSNSGGTVGESAKISGGIVGYAYNAKAKSNIEITGNTNNASVKAYSSSKDNKDAISGGVVAAAKNTTINSNTNAGSVSNTYIAGGIVGIADNCDINGATNTGAVEGAAIAGGLVGIVDGETVMGGSLHNSSTSNVVKATAGGIAGGIVALMVNGNISTNANMYNTSGVGSNATAVAGGLIGYNITFNNNNSNILTSTAGSENTGAITATAGSLLDVKDYKKYKLEASKITTSKDENYSLTVQVSGGIAGGIVGATKGNLNISNVQTGGSNTISSNYYAGGIVGYVYSGSVLLTKLSNTQPVTATNYAGGIVSIANSSITIVTDNKTVDADEPLVNISGLSFGNVTNENTATITAQTAGGIVGQNNGANIGYNGGTGSVSNAGKVISTSTGTENSGAGGIVGVLSNGSISNASNSGKIDANYSSSGAKSNAGGLVGLLQGSGKITTSNSVGGEIRGENAGGVVGLYSSGTIEDNSWGGSVTFTSSTNVGGMIGYMSATSEIKGSVSYNVNNGSNVGGLVGLMSGGSIASGTVSGSVSGATNVGGLVGEMTSGTVKRGTGGTVGNGENAGGLVGKMTNDTSKITGGTGKATSGSANVGGLVGFADGAQISGGTSAGATGTTNVGGLVGLLKGAAKIISSDNSPSVTADSSISGSNNTGGLVGRMEGSSTISAGSASGITISSGTNRGGIVGEIVSGTVSDGSGASVSGGTNSGGIAGSMSDGTISGGAGGDVSGATYGGGIVGSMTGGTVSGGAGGSVSGGSNSGGIVGIISGGTVSKGTSGTVSGGTDAGGIAGKATGGTVACSPSKDVSGTNAGGAVGRVAGNVTISANVSITVTGSAAAGGLVGVTEKGKNNETRTIYIGADLSITGTIRNNTSGSISNAAALVPVNTITIGSGSKKTIDLGENAREFGLTITNDETIGYLKVSGNGGITSTSKTSLGAIAEINNGTINQCENLTTITLTNSGGCVGGIAGKNTVVGKIIDCSNTGKIIGSTSSNAKKDGFGIDRFNDSTLNSDLATNGVRSGGLVGLNEGITEGTNSGEIQNISKYTSTSDVANIIDYRGQIAGESTSGHVKFNGKDDDDHSLDTKKNFVGTKTDYYVVMAFQYGSSTDNFDDDYYAYMNDKSVYNYLQNLSDQGALDNYIQDTIMGDKTKYNVTKLGTDELLDYRESGGIGISMWPQGTLTFDGLDWVIRNKLNYSGAWSGMKWEDEATGTLTSDVNFWRVKWFDVSEDQYEYGVDNDELQHCGGKVDSTTVIVATEEIPNQHEANALAALYNLCGEVGAAAAAYDLRNPMARTTITNCSHVTQTSNTAGKVTGKDIPAGSGSGGGGSGYASGVDEGAMNGVALSGKYAAASEKLTGNIQGLANTGLQIKQAGSGFVYGGLTSSGNFNSNSEHFMMNLYQTKKGSRTWNGISYDFVGGGVSWCVDDVVGAIETGSKWTTDCFGFIRLCQFLYFGSYTISGYGSISNKLESLDQLRSGAVLRTSNNSHVIMYLYYEGNTVHYVDQDGMKTATWSDGQLWEGTVGSSRVFSHYHNY